MQRALTAFVTLLIAACDAATAGGNAVARTPLPACIGDDSVAVGGERSGINSPVTVVAHESEGRVSLVISAADDQVHSGSFELAGSTLDEVVGQVTAEVGVVFAGEGSEYGYLRLTDERGVWFEGGRSGSIDGNAQGGSTVDGAFILGDETDDGCRLGGSAGYDVAIHDLLATIGADGDTVLLGSEGTNGVWRGVDVRAVGVRDEAPKVTAVLWPQEPLECRLPSTYALIAASTRRLPTPQMVWAQANMNSSTQLPICIALSNNRCESYQDMNSARTASQRWLETKRGKDTVDKR